MSKYCPFCGKELNDNAKFCISCGKSLDLDSNSLNSENINNNTNVKSQNNRNKVIDKIFFKNDKKTGNRRLSK